MKNAMFRLMVVGLLASSILSSAMEEAGGKGGPASFEELSVDSDKGVDTVVIPQSSAMWRIATGFVAPAVVLAGGMYAAKECRGEARGAGLAAVLFGGKSLVKNSWDAWRGNTTVTLATEQFEAVGNVEGLRGKVAELTECADRLELMAGAVLNEALPGADKKAEFGDLSAFEGDRSGWTAEQRAQHAMILAMQKAQGNPEAAAGFTGQMGAVKALLADKDEE